MIAVTLAVVAMLFSIAALAVALTGAYTPDDSPGPHYPRAKARRDDRWTPTEGPKGKAPRPPSKPTPPRESVVHPEMPTERPTGPVAPPPINPTPPSGGSNVQPPNRGEPGAWNRRSESCPVPRPYIDATLFHPKTPDERPTGPVAPPPNNLHKPLAQSYVAYWQQTVDEILANAGKPKRPPSGEVGYWLDQLREAQHMASRYDANPRAVSLRLSRITAGLEEMLLKPHMTGLEWERHQLERELDGATTLKEYRAASDALTAFNAEPPTRPPPPEPSPNRYGMPGYFDEEKP